MLSVKHRADNTAKGYGSIGTRMKPVKALIATEDRRIGRFAVLENVTRSKRPEKELTSYRNRSNMKSGSQPVIGLPTSNEDELPGFSRWFSRVGLRADKEVDIEPDQQQGGVG
jgi:hypothetical protein